MAPARPLTVGTLSFARCRADMVLRPAERTRLILAASDAYTPDLLVTSGYAVDSRKQLHRLAQDIVEDEREGIIVTEVHHDGRPRRDVGRSHAMWAIRGDGRPQRLGRQAFATGREASAPLGKGLRRLRRHLPSRDIGVGVYSAFGLICGELNIVRGRETGTLRFLDDEVGAAIMAADIVINPTHDRMGRAGLLDAKRRYLSQPHADGRPRAYISCSNWEVCGYGGRVQHPSPSLHTVYLSSKPQPYEELADGAFGFVYRQWRLDLAGSG